MRAFGLLEYSSLPGTKRTRFRIIPLKRGFWPARRPEAMRTGVREPLENAAGQVPQHHISVPMERV